MTWIAACSGQRGIYQEVIMTDEERHKLLANLRMVEFAAPTYAKQWCGIAANEIERLAAELAQARCESQMTDAEYIAFRQRIADEQGTEFVAND
jgi:hypothetical protein